MIFQDWEQWHHGLLLPSSMYEKSGKIKKKQMYKTEEHDTVRSQKSYLSYRLHQTY
jgi:hypothetical protein